MKRRHNEEDKIDSKKSYTYVDIDSKYCTISLYYITPYGTTRLKLTL
jgi:hypothetical protein